jgi:NitT/TauT family transport system ATP-binding protein
MEKNLLISCEKGDRLMAGKEEKASDSVVVKVENVYKAYGRNRVLESLNLEVSRGKFTCLIGPSGCGKSVLVYLIAGYEQPDRGTIYLNGNPIRKPGSDRLVVFQETELFNWMNLWDNTSFGLVVQNKPLNDVVSISKTWIDRVGLGGFEEKYPLQLSGGMQRRAELLRSLVNQPEIMLMDEPFRGLDALSRQFMQEYTTELFEEVKIPILFITTEIEEAIFLSDEIVFLSQRPARLVKKVRIDLPRPRKLEMVASEEFFKYKSEAIDLLYSKEMVEEGGWEIIKKLGREVTV